MFDKTNTFCISQSSNSLWFVPNILQDPFVHYFNIVERSRRQSHIQIWNDILMRNLACALVYEEHASYTIPLLCNVAQDDRMELVKHEGIENDWNLIRLSGDSAYLISRSGAKWLTDTYNGKFVSLERMLLELEHTKNYVDISL
jgi:hypothetical protein